MIIWMIFLLAAGLALIVLEVFIPGGVAGTIGALALAASVVLAFRLTEFGVLWLLVTLSLSLASLLLSVKFVARSPMGKKIFLSADEKGTRGTDGSLDVLAGSEGTALTELRPAGIARFGANRRIDVVTEGEYISRGARIRVLQVTGNRVVVAQVSPEPETGGQNA